MKTIYVLLTKSSTMISKVISATTGDRYTHVSISFNKNLCPLYSFSREYIYLPLPATIKKEKLNKGLYKRFDSMPCALYAIKVDDEKYIKVRKDVEQMMENRNQYGYNLIGLLLCRLGLKSKRENKFFCSQFVSKVLMDGDIIERYKDPSLVRPNEFSKMKQFDCLYQGELRHLANQKW